MVQIIESEVSGIGFDAEAFPSQPGTEPGWKFNSLGQTSNRAGSTVPNMDVGTVALPIPPTPPTVAGTTLTVTIFNALITSKSFVFVQPMNVANTAGGRGLMCAVHVPSDGSVVVDVTVLQTTVTGDYELLYWIRN